jgi:hypothetical protein
MNRSAWLKNSAFPIKVWERGGKQRFEFCAGNVCWQSRSQVVYKQGSTKRMTGSETFDNLNRLLAISSAPSGAAAMSFIYSYDDGNQRSR